jgi:hypothetical protein
VSDFTFSESCENESCGQKKKRNITIFSTIKCMCFIILDIFTWFESFNLPENYNIILK